MKIIRRRAGMFRGADAAMPDSSDAVRGKFGGVLSRHPRRHACTLSALAMMIVPLTSAADAQSPDLGTAASFAVLAGSTVTNTGSSVLTGNVGLSPGSAIVGFPPGLVLAPGAFHAGDAVALQAQIDLTIGYNAIASRPTTADLTGTNLGGRTLVPGVYNFNTSAQLTGALTLNALGNPNAVFIFNIGTTLTTASGSLVRVIGGGNASNVFWRIGSSATLGTTTSFVGDILALTSITLNTGASVSCGSALARNGAVTLDTNTIGIRNLAPCLATLLPAPVVTPVVAPVVAVIEGAFAGTGGAVPQAFLNLSALTPDQLTGALRQLSGEAGTGVAQVGIQSMNSFLSLVLNPFAGGPSADRGGFGPNAPAPTGIPLKTLASATNITKAIAGANFDQQPWAVWGAAYGGVNKTDGDSAQGTSDRTARAYGFATGFDYRVSPDTVVGFALAGGGTAYGIADSLGGGHSDMAQAAIYSSTHIDAAYVSAALAYGWHSVSTDRWLSVQGSDHLAADFSAQSLGSRLEAGYRFALPGLFGLPGSGITPYGAVQAQVFRTPSYSEHAVTGSAAFALDYDGRTSDVLRTELGAWFDQAVVFDNGSLVTLRLRAAWAHDEFSDPTVGAAFQSLPGSAFTVTGAKPVSDSALLSAAASMKVARNVSIGARFDSEIADRSQTYAGTGTVRYAW
jgi:uncharacterized protein with beta-barrel porin domain